MEVNVFRVFHWKCIAHPLTDTGLAGFDTLNHGLRDPAVWRLYMRTQFIGATVPAVATTLTKVICPTPITGYTPEYKIIPDGPRKIVSTDIANSNIACGTVGQFLPS
jgi:hypothetical protein